MKMMRRKWQLKDDFLSRRSSTKVLSFFFFFGFHGKSRLQILICSDSRLADKKFYWPKVMYKLASLDYIRQPVHILKKSAW